MSYIRKKKFGGREYWYLCKSVREGSKVRQKVIKYLGTKKPSPEELEIIKKGDINNEALLQLFEGKQ